MTNVIGIPALLFFFILTVFVVRSRRVSWLDVAILVCFGFYLNGSSVGEILNGIVHDLGNLFGSGR
jgi:hypothetical protein